MRSKEIPTMGKGRSWIGFARTIVVFAPLLILWEVLTQAKVWPRIFFPSLGDVAQTFVDLIKNGILPLHVVASLNRLFISAAIAVTLGIGVGVLLGVNKWIYRFFFPLVSFFQAIAEIGWLPLVIIWLGFGFRTIIVVTCYTIFFTVAINTSVGIRRVPQHLINSVRTLGGRRRHVLFGVLLPGAMPSMVTGVRLGLGYGWRALIAAEILVGQAGLGFMIFDARKFQMTDRIVLGMIVIGTLWLVTDRFILRPIEGVTTERWGTVARAQ
jgi:NitT/TauT family transport system permease protein/taurine transport system permease protein